MQIKLKSSQWGRTGRCTQQRVGCASRHTCPLSTRAPMQPCQTVQVDQAKQAQAPASANRTSAIVGEHWGLGQVDGHHDAVDGNLRVNTCNGIGVQLRRLCAGAGGASAGDDAGQALSSAARRGADGGPRAAGVSNCLASCNRTGTGQRPLGLSPVSRERAWQSDVALVLVPTSTLPRQQCQLHIMLSMLTTLVDLFVRKLGRQEFHLRAHSDVCRALASCSRWVPPRDEGR